MTESVLGWWFHDGSGKLPHGDGRPIVLGETHEVSGVIKTCVNGLHSSETVFDALYYAKGFILFRVLSTGIIAREVDKLAASKRTYISKIDAKSIFLINFIQITN